MPGLYQKNPLYEHKKTIVTKKKEVSQHISISTFWIFRLNQFIGIFLFYLPPYQYLRGGPPSCCDRVRVPSYPELTTEDGHWTQPQHSPAISQTSATLLPSRYILSIIIIITKSTCWYIQLILSSLLSQILLWINDAFVIYRTVCHSCFNNMFIWRIRKVSLNVLFLVKASFINL